MIPLCPDHSHVAPLHLCACKYWMLGWEERRHNLLPQASCSLKPPYTHWALHWAGREREDGNIPLSPSVSASYSTLAVGHPCDSAESLYTWDFVPDPYYTAWVQKAKVIQWLI